MYGTRRVAAGTMSFHDSTKNPRYLNTNKPARLSATPKARIARARDPELSAIQRARAQLPMPDAIISST